MREVDLAWLAGWLEGEGCFHANIRQRRGAREYRSASISVSATDEDVVGRAADLMDTTYRPMARRDNRKQAYVINMSGAKAIELMRALQPQMGVRRAAKIAEVLTIAGAMPGIAFGAKCGQAKLTDENVREIRREYASNGRHGSQSALARRFGVSQSSIWYIVRGKTWKRAA